MTRLWAFASMRFAATTARSVKASEGEEVCVRPPEPGWLCTLNRPASKNHRASTMEQNSKRRESIFTGAVVL